MEHKASCWYLIDMEEIIKLIQYILDSKCRSTLIVMSTS